MIKYIVPLHIAQKLKILNFNWGVDTVYPEIGDGATYKFSDIPAKVPEHDWNKRGDYISAPSWDQALDWLRTVHNIHISVDSIMVGPTGKGVFTGDFCGSAYSTLTGNESAAHIIDYCDSDYFRAKAGTLYNVLVRLEGTKLA